MASVQGLDRSGPLFFFSFLSLIATIIGFIRGSQCGFLRCSYIFLIITLFFLFWGIEEAT